MKKFVFLLFILLHPRLLAVEVKSYGGTTLIRPLGYMHHKRPPIGARSVTILDHSIEFSAQQICGYTDWTTAVIKLPKELLSIKYWEKIGQNLVKQATDSVLAVTGALPAMLACNVSPTFCALMNRAEALAQANLRFNFDSCQMLEGLDDVYKSNFTALGRCVKQQTDNGMASNKAQDFCKLKDQEAGLSKKDMADNVSSQSSWSYDQSDLFKKACKEQEYEKYSSSTHAYSVTEMSCKWLKDFFPGVSLTASGKLRHGGTFSNSAAEKNYEDNIHYSTIFIIALIEKMHAIRYGLGRYASKGPLPRHLVIEHRDIWEDLGVQANGKLKGVCYPEDGDRCVSDITRLPPVYRFSLVGGLPSLLIHPSTLYEVIDVFPKNTSLSAEFEKKDSQISLILGHLIQATAYARTQDLVRDGHQRVLDACRKEPSLQNVGAQADCDAKIAKLTAEKESLRVRSETDQNHLQAQMQFYSELSRLKATRSSVRADIPERSFDSIIDPQDYK